VPRKPQQANIVQPMATADCSRISDQLDRNRGWEAESKMRVASLESILAVATLVSAIVVVLWGIKIFYSV
jgi:hypothetical protein